MALKGGGGPLFKGLWRIPVGAFSGRQAASILERPEIA